jgi:hypothetical protein
LNRIQACISSGTAASGGINRRNVWGITPTTVTGCPFRRIRRPTIERSPP